MEEMDLEFLIDFIISFNMSKFEVYAPDTTCYAPASLLS